MKSKRKEDEENEEQERQGKRKIDKDHFIQKKAVRKKKVGGREDRRDRGLSTISMNVHVCMYVCMCSFSLDYAKEKRDDSVPWTGRGVLLMRTSMRSSGDCVCKSTPPSMSCWRTLSCLRQRASEKRSASHDPATNR